VSGSKLNDLLSKKKDAITGRWLDKIVASYPEDYAGFLKDERNQVRNPVGAALSKATRGIVEGLLAGEETSRLAPLLDEVIRIRAVQELSASQVVAFVFALKGAIWEEAGGSCTAAGTIKELVELESRIDGLALAAFDAYSQARERLSEVRVNEMRRRVYLLERTHPALDRELPDPAGEGGPPDPTKRGGGS
jgi:hypothetical protein